MESSILWFSFNRSIVNYGCQLLKSHALLTVNMSKKKSLFHPVSSKYKKKVFCAVSLQFRINHTCVHTLTSTHMHAYIHQKKNQYHFYTVNNAMYPWHNQKDSAKAIA